MLATDFGDAPAPYPVTLAEDGARHETTGPVLGSDRSDEPDGLHSEDATADSHDDGVAFSPIQIGQLATSIIVSVSTTAKLDGASPAARARL